MKKLFSIPAFLLLTLFFMIGCVGVAADPNQQLATIVATTLTAVAANVSPAPPIQESATPELATMTPAPVVTLTSMTAGVRYVYTQAESVNLRVNPGRLFKVSRVLPKGTKLQVLGAAPGGKWLNVLNEEGIIGWVGVDFVSSGFDAASLPLVTPKDAQIVTGKVLDVNGSPVAGIGFAITQDTQREDAVSDAAGVFYAYLPPKFSGAWNVEFVSVDCKSSTMDANCQCVGGVCGRPDPQIAVITLPLSAPLSFVWR